METGWNHFDERGSAVMVDVSGKAPACRTAVAGGKIRMHADVLRAVEDGTAAKGDVLGVARIAGIMGAKQTAHLIPLCHPLGLDSCTVDFAVHREQSCIEAFCTVRVNGRTGVEMEALTGVTLALLTIYDMCKAIDKAMELSDIRLIRKEGGKSGVFVNEKAGQP